MQFLIYDPVVYGKPCIFIKVINLVNGLLNNYSAQCMIKIDPSTTLIVSLNITSLTQNNYFYTMWHS